jgi:alpha-methylacyl-CoA racemase
MGGTLEGIRIVEMAGLGPGPFCAMMLADHGADVIRIERPGSSADDGDCLARNRTVITLDLKRADARAIALDLCRDADGLIEGYRPGVMERLGLGPDALLSINPRLVYGRMTGWGQHGPLSQRPGHDINYIAVAGVLDMIGSRGGPPIAPGNFVGDIAGGGMMLAFGMVAALLRARISGAGQVIDCAMSDGAALVSATVWSLINAGKWKPERGTNVIDGGAHFYGTYQCRDGKYLALGSAEPQFYAELRRIVGLDEDAFQHQRDQTLWPHLRARLEQVFKTRSQAEWMALLDGSEACVSPVLSPHEAMNHPHNRARQTFLANGAAIHPAPAPRFSAAQPRAPEPASRSASDTLAVLQRLGYDEAKIAALVDGGAVALPQGD